MGGNFKEKILMKFKSSESFTISLRDIITREKAKSNNNRGTF